jgi:four helix bundle protein
MAGARHFTDLEVWRKAHTLFIDLLEVVDQFPEKRGARVLTDQVLRSSGSISANISEGFDRSKKRFLSYLDIAKGSCYETENWLYKARDAKYCKKEKANELLRRTIEINKMLHGLIRAVSSR